MKSLVVVDAQIDFISGVFGSEKAQEVLPKIVEYVKNFEGTVRYTMDIHDKIFGNTMELQKLPEHCMDDTIGQEVPLELKVELKKKGASCFRKCTFMPDEEYDDISLWESYYMEYHDKGVFGKENTIYICGYCTDICVLNTALYLRNHCLYDRIVVLKDLCAGSTPEMHEKALDIMRVNLIEVEDSHEA